jgi:hypothetical protein
MNRWDSLFEAMFLQIGEKRKAQVVNNLSLRKIVCLPTIWCSACFLAYYGAEELGRRICAPVEE